MNPHDSRALKVLAAMFLVISTVNAIIELHNKVSEDKEKEKCNCKKTS